MTNEEKAIEISEKHAQYETDFNQETTIRLQRYNAAMLMAEWKEQQMLAQFRDFLNSIGRGQQFGRFERQLKGEDKD